ncbi:MAG: SMI1/KNR4 family protein [Acidovorax sp.]|nr:SMI1/KNR4 family protein [Acidovorax sp.]
MDITQFRKIDALGRLKRTAIFEAAPPEVPATESEIAAIESAMNIKISNKYKQFLTEFGGGNYGLAIIFSAKKNSEWYLPAQVIKTRGYLPPDYLPVSDDFSGGVYCQKLKDFGACEEIYYWNLDGGILKTDYSDIFELIGNTAY